MRRRRRRRRRPARVRTCAATSISSVALRSPATTRPERRLRPRSRSATLQPPGRVRAPRRRSGRGGCRTAAAVAGARRTVAAISDAGGGSCRRGYAGVDGARRRHTSPSRCRRQDRQPLGAPPAAAGSRVLERPSWSPAEACAPVALAWWRRDLLERRARRARPARRRRATTPRSGPAAPWTFQVITPPPRRSVGAGRRRRPPATVWRAAGYLAPPWIV